MRHWGFLWAPKLMLRILYSVSMPASRRLSQPGGSNRLSSYFTEALSVSTAAYRENMPVYAVALEPRLACKAPLCERLLPRSMPIRP